MGCVSSNITGESWRLDHFSMSWAIWSDLMSNKSENLIQWYSIYMLTFNYIYIYIVWSTSLNDSSVTWIHIRNDGWLDDWRSVATPACTFETSMELSLAVQQCFDHRYMAKACRTSALLAWFRLGVVWLVHAQNLLLYIVILHYL